jgi:hypothetical protein
MGPWASIAGDLNCREMSFMLILQLPQRLVSCGVLGNVDSAILSNRPEKSRFPPPASKNRFTMPWASGAGVQ